MVPCPFCGAQAASDRCGACGRDPTASRLVCAKCSKMTPAAEAACCHCGASRKSEMPGKVVIIVMMFIAALIVSILLAAVR